MCNIMPAATAGERRGEAGSPLEEAMAERMECRRNFGYVFNFLHTLATRGPLLLLGYLSVSSFHATLPPGNFLAIP